VVKDYMFGVQEIVIKVIGLMTKCMDLEYLLAEKILKLTVSF
jgi:hypothetical protein